MLKFGTDGWRAVISEEFTYSNVRKVAQAIADYLTDQRLKTKDQRPLIIGYDARFLADKFAEEVVRVMLENGISCFLTERDTPTPVVAWEVKDKKAVGAVMITASHNPPEYCGIKFIPDYAGPADDEITQTIEKGLEGPPAGRAGMRRDEKGLGGKVERFEPRERYLKYLESFVDAAVIRRAKLKVVVDPMYGSGRGYLDKLLQRLGCQVEEIHGYRDVLFGGRNPEPSDENLEELKQKVKAEKAVLGLALDGDADRFGVVDETGKFLDANQVLSLLFEYLVAERGFTGSAVRSAATTHMLDRVASRHHLKVFETPVGFKHIAKLMMQEDIIIGGEESGGLSIKGHIPEKDGILADLLMVEMVARLKKPLSQIWKNLTAKVGEAFGEKINLHLEEEKKNELLDGLRGKEELAGVKVLNKNFLDGVKLILIDGSWVLARPSGTEPLVRVYVESDKEEKLKAIGEAVKNLL